MWERSCGPRTVKNRGRVRTFVVPFTWPIVSVGVSGFDLSLCKCVCVC